MLASLGSESPNGTALGENGNGERAARRFHLKI